MRILLDTDVLVDLALDRRPHAESAARLIDRIQRGRAEGYIAWHSASNFYYLVSGAKGAPDARAFLLDLVRFIGVAPTDAESLRIAGRLTVGDFEDAMQVAAAIACGAEVIATRNVRDFRESPVPALTPADLVRSFDGST